MKYVSIDEIENNLSSYLQMAENEYVAIAREGVPVGILIGLADSEDWWEELVLHSPGFIERIEQARKSLREGKGISIEQMRAKYGI